MAKAATIAVQQLMQILGGDAGLLFSLAGRAQEGDAAFDTFGTLRVVTQQTAADLAEKAQQAKYPAVYVYCERVVNELKEKFRTFSGRAALVMEVRVSHDRLEELDGLINLYVDGATEVLENSRGQWANGIFYPGGYEVVYGPAKHGGRNFLQSAKIRFEVLVSVN